jgi:thioredoxin-related protein
MFPGFKKYIAAIFFCFLISLSGWSQHGQLVDFAIVKDMEIWSPEQKKVATIGSSGKMELLVLISPECPMCINYTLTLNTLKEQYANEMRITGLVAGSAYSDEAVLAFARAYNISYAILTDRKNDVVKKLKGEVTPEVYLFDQTGQCVYRGAIDNWLTTLGKKKTKPDQFYLADAIQQTIKGEPVTTAYVQAQGCALNEY